MQTTQKRGLDRVALSSIILAHTSVDMQTAALPTLLPMLLTTFHLDYASAAALVTVNNLMIAVAQPLFGILGDRKPVRWLSLLGCAICGIAMNTVTWLPSYWLVFAAVILSGLGSALFHPEALSNTRSISGDRAVTGTSWFFLGGNLGFGGGPILVGMLLSGFGPHGAVALIVPTIVGCGLLLSQMHKFGRRHVDVVAAVDVAELPVAAAASHAAAPQPVVSGRSVALFVGFLLFLIILRSVALEGLKTFIPLYFSQVTGKSAAEFASLLGTLSLAGIVGTVFSGPLADRIGRRNTMVWSMIAATASLFWFLNTDGVWQLVAIGLFGIATTAPWTITVTMVQDAMPRNPGLAAGLTLGTAYGAAGIGVGLLGVLANNTGLWFTLQFITAIPVLVTVLSLFVPERPRAQFVPASA